MNRSRLLIAIVALVAIPVVALRVRTALQQNLVKILAPATTPAWDRLDASSPPDYVAHPVVAAGEETHGPRRLVSLAPSITEIVCALGMRDRLVGRTPYCTWPPGIESVAEVGALLDTNYEKIKSLNPDLVLITANSRGIMASLEQLHVPYAPIPHDTLEEVYEAIRRLGALCDRPRTAETLVNAIRGDVARLKARAQELPGPPVRTIVTLGVLPVPPQAVFAAGPGSFLEALLQMAGGTNAAREALVSSHGEIPLEKLLFINPDVILEFREPVGSQEMVDLYRAWTQVGALRAIDQQHVRSIGGLEWLSAGPRIAVELHRFIQVLAEFRPGPPTTGPAASR